MGARSTGRYRSRELGPEPLESLRAARHGRAFFLRGARVVARALIGTYLVHAPPGRPARAVRIVETEAYCGPKDLACHARVGLTKRTKTLLGPPGRAYVFLIYGMYDCFNVTCVGEGSGQAVLVRAGEPASGIEKGVRCDGPGRLSRALGITRADDGADLTGDTLFLSARVWRPAIAVTARVGVGYAGAWADRPWRFLDPTSHSVSRPHERLIGRGV
jgi:DNA-3-methyladenine glycosylase